MQSSNCLDWKIHEILAVPLPGVWPRVGVEVELEGSNLPTGGIPGWKVKPEHSLRGGFEYVFTQPHGPEKTAKSIENLAGTMKNYTPVTSIRTSTHIHVDVLPFSQKQLFNALGLYYLIEPLLVRTQPETRWGNLFCLEMDDAPGVQASLIEAIKSQMYFSMFHIDGYKYAACNLSAIHRFGSLEFRFLQAYYDETNLTRWVDIFTRLISYGTSKSIAQHISEYDNYPVKTFLEKIFGPHVHYLCEGKSTYELNDLLQTNYDNVRELDYFLSQYRFQMPKSMWKDDQNISDSGQPVGGGFGDIGVGYTGQIIADDFDDMPQAEEVSW